MYYNDKSEFMDDIINTINSQNDMRMLKNMSGKKFESKNNV